ncbi:hypothetical protein EDD36DRAFT_460979 [Exophiala viscosa]|uniref:Protein kinase domain-containing protein n=1 Tax=Exophiala viscosa TaxID=2486360 RepID=A0AAN6E2W2_9EURO|nr:hypothetical protein EDD36DRAFT_460979 [Exophiala viscosa]
MAPGSQSWWTDDRVNETVTIGYVHSQLRPGEQELLRRPLYFGGDLTDDTYLDWILTRAKRFFLILVAIGVPDQIFGIVDDSYDDEDLPIADYAVPDLRLSFQPDPALDKRFYKTQFRFLSRIVALGEHIRYANEETVPVNTLGLKSVVMSLGYEGTDRVRIPDNPTVYVRRRISVADQSAEEELLSEIAANRRLVHEHVVSVFASYTHEGFLNVLSSPAPEWSLKSFLTDTPKAFDNLTKTQRRHILINWPHCLANALAWLHNNGDSHGAIRPSNIQVDESFNISLGLLAGDGVLRGKVRSDDIEAYQYAPPERWKRAVTYRSTGSASVVLPSGGRTGRRMTTNDKSGSSDGRNSVRSISGSAIPTYTFQPMSKGNYARLRLRAAKTLDNSSLPTIGGSSTDAPSTPTDDRSISTQGTARPDIRTALPVRAPSIMSSTSSTGTRETRIPAGPVFVAPPEGRSTMVQQWQSIEQDMFASDMFSLGAVMMDIMTVLCKRTYSAFSRHRSTKNRMAGRGGGLADASFHANLGQVFSWAQSLENEANKKSKKDESQALSAVGPVVQLALQCLARDPVARMTSEKLESRLAEHISRSASIVRLHCTAGALSDSSSEQTASIPIRQKNRSEPEKGSTERQQRRPSTNALAAQGEHHPGRRIDQPDEHILQSPILFTSTSPSAITPPAITPVSSLASFNFDGRSDTVVAESPHSRVQSVRGPTRRDPHHEPWLSDGSDKDTPKKREWKTWHDNDSQVMDPRLSYSESIDTGAFTYINYSTSASSEDEQGGLKFFPRREQQQQQQQQQQPQPPPLQPKPPTTPPTRHQTPPDRPPPDRALPPVPPLPAAALDSPKTSRRRTKDSPKNSPRQSRVVTRNQGQTQTREELPAAAMPPPIARRYPTRKDSLTNLGLHEDDDYHDIIRHTGTRRSERSDPAKAAPRSRSKHSADRHDRHAA